MIDKVKDLTRKLDDYKQAHQRQVADEIHGLVIKLKEEVAVIKQDITVIRQDMADVRQITITREEISQLNALLPIKSDSNVDSDKACLPETREDILTDIYDWASGQYSEKIFWLYGIAGSGKSAISNTVGKYLELMKISNACFFCKRDDPMHNNPRRVLPTLAYQLAQTNEHYRWSLLEVNETRTMSENMSIQDQFDYLFQGVAKHPQFLAKNPESDYRFIVVIDALDECGMTSGRKSLLQSLVKLPELWTWIKIFITSREEKDITDIISSVSRKRNSYEIDDNVKDVKTLLASFAKDKDLNLKPHEIERLSELSKGLFIWIATIVKFLENEGDKSYYIKLFMEGEEFATAEGQLDGIYSTILNIASGDSQRNKLIIKTILSVIVVSADREFIPYEVLKLALSHVLNDISKTKDFLDKLHSVIYTDKNSDSIRVYHPSFADYVQTKKRCGEQYWVDKQETKCLIASTCLKIMMKQLTFNLCQLESSLYSNKDMDNLIQQNLQGVSNELRYSSYNWVFYIPDIDIPQVDVKLVDLYKIIQYFLSSKKLLFWIELLSLCGHVFKLTDILDDLDYKLTKVCVNSTSDIII
jgi:hypothetical protein